MPKSASESLRQGPAESGLELGSTLVSIQAERTLHEWKKVITRHAVDIAVYCEGRILESQVSTPSMRTVQDPKIIFTIGYEGDTPEGVVWRLTSAGVKRLVDVREVPRSRSPGFSRTTLSSYLAIHGVEYVHLSPLGSPRSAREDYLKSGDFGDFEIKYKAHLAGQDEAMRLLASLAEARSTAIMCLEKDPARCHRSMIASRMVALGFEVRHL